jgi:hypothetical protein
MQLIDEPAEPARWPLALRVAFRFVFAYFAILLIPIRVLGWLPFGERLQEGYALLWHGVVVWVGQRIVTSYDLSQVESGISNSAHGTIEMFCYVAAALLLALIWSVLDRRRVEYARLHAWLRVLLRFALAPMMIHYGMLKIVPTQMIAPPPLGLQAQRLGELHPNQMLWAFMGTSPTYESLTGVAELDRRPAPALPSHHAPRRIADVRQHAHGLHDEHVLRRACEGLVAAPHAHGRGADRA